MKRHILCLILALGIPAIADNSINGIPASTPLLVASVGSATNATTGTLTSSSVTTSGSVTTGAIWMSFTLSADFTGSINGVARDGATILSVPFGPVQGYKYPAIAYVRTTGTITIDQFR